MANNLRKGETDYSNIIKAEESIAFNEFETAFVFNELGIEMFRVIGDFGKVKFSPSQKSQMVGMIVTHNHPYKLNSNGAEREVSVSHDDVNLAFCLQIKELRLVHGSKVHSFLWREGSNENGLKILVDKVKAINAKISIMLYKAYINGAGRKSLETIWQDGSWQIIDLLKANECVYHYTYTIRRRS